MAEITHKKYPEQKLVVFTVKGNAAVEDFLDTISRFQDDKDDIPNVIWDASQGTVGELKADDMRKITELLKKGHGMRPNGKTALVGPTDLEYGTGRMFEAYAEIENLSVQYKTFRSLDEAMEWIHEDNIPG